MNKHTTDVKLTHEEELSPAWMKVSRYVNEQLALARTALESDADPIVTAKLRGRIASLNLIAALGIPAPLIVEEEEPD